MDEQRKTTPLHPCHVGQSASMACFGGYHMPLWYPAGAKAEHLAVLTAAGLFDTSHIALLSLHGPGARPHAPAVGQALHALGTALHAAGKVKSLPMLAALPAWADF